MSKETDQILDQLRNLDSLPAAEDLPTGMKTKEEKLITLTYEKLKLAAESNPGHPLASGYIRSVNNLTPNQQVHVSRVDLQCLLENKESITYEEVENVQGRNRIIIRKKVGASLGPTSAEPKTSKSPIRKTTHQTKEA